MAIATSAPTHALDHNLLSKRGHAHRDIVHPSQVGSQVKILAGKLQYPAHRHDSRKYTVGAALEPRHISASGIDECVDGSA
jgi:hypothetical protein